MHLSNSKLTSTFLRSKTFEYFFFFTLLSFHSILVKVTYQQLFSALQNGPYFDMRDLYIVVIKFSQISGYKILAVLGNTQFMKTNALSADFFRARF